ncbi:uncharacterized protein LOC129319279 [Prosopis cineraria]|uniref:uncharacterized protein LOC129319279 n=1 Tax=Prosopis cineraria TaxID=364024 RepID=UPI00241045D2|nr:uncharacterized protein LOC129319279 [Prosopis cineraria]XP_054820266.1 uncharacterized protein LOC129319279 [Prosopis cineraria]
MGEIDTKPIEPVRTALSLFEDKGDQKNYQPTRIKHDYEKEMEDLSKELANYKVKLEAKHAAHMQALFKLEQRQKMTYELSTLLKNSDAERNKYMNECVESRARIDELESKVKEMTEQNLKNANIHEQLLQVLSELKATQKELLSRETELVEARDSELQALEKAEELENACQLEKLKKKELLHQVNELNEAIHRSKLAATEAEKEKLGMLSDRDQTIELASKAFAQAQKQAEDLKNQLEMLKGLENERAPRSVLVDEAIVSADESATSAIKEDSNQLHTDMDEFQKELHQLKQEHHNAKEEIKALNIIVQSLKDELQNAKAEANILKERDIKAQVDNALLMSQLQEVRSIFLNPDDKKDPISTPLKEHKSLVRQAEKTKQVQDSEVAFLKKELGAATAKIGELRARAEQALSRAELAERAKEALEDALRRQKEQRHRRKASVNAIQEGSTPKQDTQSSSDGTPKKYYPLGKVLNMKF